MAASSISSLICLLLVATASTTKIESFDAKADIGFLGEHSTAYATFIELWTSVTGCPEDKCTCEVTVENRSGSSTVEFYRDKPKIGRAIVTELQPFTKYKITLTCLGEKDSDRVSTTKEISTDKGKPSAPENIAANAEAFPVKLTWAPPKSPAGPIDYYQFWTETSPNNLVATNISSTDRSYDITETNDAGQQRSVYLTACNVDQRNHAVCSNPNDGALRITFPTTTTSKPTAAPVSETSTTTTTLSPSTTTTPKSFAVASSSISASMMFVGLSFVLFGFGR